MIIATSLAASVVIFTLLLKATTALLGVPQFVWQLIAGGIVVIFGLTLLFPVIWERVMTATGLQRRQRRAGSASYRRGGVGGDILLGAALGPTFSSCSPTYALILATVLPVSFGEGLLYIVVYALGLAIALLLVAFLGQAFARKLGWLSSPSGWFPRVVGILLVIVGLAVILGLDKQFQAFVLEQGWYDPIQQFEEGITAGPRCAGLGRLVAGQSHIEATSALHRGDGDTAAMSLNDAPARSPARGPRRGSVPTPVRECGPR